MSTSNLAKWQHDSSMPTTGAQPTSQLRAVFKHRQPHTQTRGKLKFCPHCFKQHKLYYCPLIVTGSATCFACSLLSAYSSKHVLTQPITMLCNNTNFSTWEVSSPTMHHNINKLIVDLQILGQTDLSIRNRCFCFSAQSGHIQFAQQTAITVILHCAYDM